MIALHGPTYVYWPQKTKSSVPTRTSKPGQNSTLGSKRSRCCAPIGGEYLGKEFSQYLSSQGTERKLTVHDTPQYNGVSERLNRTLLERTRALLHSSELPKNLLGEAINHVVWLKNRTTT